MAVLTDQGSSFEGSDGLFALESYHASVDVLTLLPQILPFLEALRLRSFLIPPKDGAPKNDIFSSSNAKFTCERLGPRGGHREAPDEED